MRFRSTVGPLIVALSVWCAAGVVAVARAETSNVRIAAPASWWILAAAFAAAMLVPGWRRDARLALPAALATLPWWPVPLPPIAFIWTGPLAWLPVAVSCVIAIGTRPLVLAARSVGALDRHRAPWIAAGLTLTCCVFAAASADYQVPEGDEPHYLILTQSLLLDGDLQIQNNHDRGDYREYFGGDLHADFVKRGRHGEPYSIHAPGVSVLVLPAFALFGHRGAEATILFCAALTGMLIWRIGWHATRDVAAAWFAWAAATGSLTFVLQSFTIFPDGPAALVIAASILLLIRLATGDSPRLSTLAVVSALVATLPWLHTRLSVLLVGLMLVIAARLALDRPAGDRLRRLATFLVLPSVSLVAWFVFFQILYGTPNPAAPYGDTSGPSGNHLRYIPGGLVGLLFDQQFGLLAYAPVLAVVCGGLVRSADRRLQSSVIASLGIAAAYLSAAATWWMWWSGNPATPARYVAPVLAVTAAPLAIAWQRASTSARQCYGALLLLSVTITGLVVGTNRATMGWNMRDGQALWLNWLGPVVNLPRGWPSFFWRLDPGHVSSEWPFALHVSVLIGIAFSAWLVVRALLASRQWSDAQRRVAIGVAMLAIIMAVMQVGWSLNGVSGLDPTRSQLSVLRRSRGSVALVVMRPWSIARATNVGEVMAIRSEEPAKFSGAAPWLALTGVPPGRYELQISLSRPRTCVAFVRVDDSAEMVRTLTIAPRREQSFEIALPVGAHVLTVDAEDPERMTGVNARLVPIQVK